MSLPENTDFSFNGVNSYFPPNQMGPRFTAGEFVSGIGAPRNCVEEAIAQTPSSSTSNRGKRKHKRRANGRESVGKGKSVDNESNANCDMAAIDSFYPPETGVEMDTPYSLSNKDINTCLEEVLALKKAELLGNPEIQQLLKDALMR